MIDRYFITLGAPTTAGGKVSSASRFETINGAPVAVEGDTCWCAKCLSEGVIRADGPRLSDTIDGRQVASQTFMCQSIDSNWFASQEAAATAAAAQANAAGLDAPERDQLPLVLVDPDTQEAITDLPYRLDLASTQVASTLDHKGWTDPLGEAERASSVTVQPDATGA
jgi:uncharacterized Zn-binding protein involved in type VI secretion